MSDQIRDLDSVNLYRADEAKPTGDEPEKDTASEARPCTVPVRPGYGQAAYKAGCEDEYIDRMATKYGGEW